MKYPLLCLTLLASLFILNPSAQASSCYGDYEPPVAICDAHTVVALGADGVATVYAYNLDDGSYDNCEISHFKAARMWAGWCPYGVVDDTQFRPYVQFCCEDVGAGAIWIVMQVTDTHGNSNTCMVQVTVQSGGGSLHCPYDKTIYCDYWFDWNDLYDPWNTFFGWPTTSGGCSNADVTVEVHDHRNSCGTGYIKRIFSTGGGGYGGGYGNDNSCIQHIWVVDYHPFNGYSIHWPYDYTVAGCDDYAHTDPHDLPHGYDKPYWEDDNCSLIGYSWDDKVFHFEGGACTKIVRTWTVIDWCVYDPNHPYYSGGIWTHVQIIKLTDNQKPQFEYCEDMTVNGLEADCKGRFINHPNVWDDCTPLDKLKLHYKIDLYGNGSIDILKHYGYIDELLPSGTHKVYWYVDDNCGNTNSCVFWVTIKDLKAPTPICFANLSTVLMPIGGMVTIWAKDFDASSFDNCTKAHQLKFSFSSNVHEASRTFTCDDVGLVALQVYVTDLAGNQAYCNTFITLTDNGPVCPEMNPITGSLEMFTSEAISGADVSLYKDKPNGMVMDMTVKSAADGSYRLGFGTTQFDRMLEVTKEVETMAGITTLDLIYLQQHIIGINDLDHPAALKAADVDGSGRAGVNDLIMLRDAFLSGGRTLRGLTWPWKFYPSDCEWLPNGEPTCSFNVSISQNYVVPPYDFIGYKIGDINGDIMQDPSQRNADKFEIGVRYDASERAYSFIALEDAEILGMQMSMGNSVPMTEELAGGELNLGSQNCYVDVDARIINMSWTTPTTQNISKGDVLFYMPVSEFQATRVDQFSLVKGVYRSEIYLTDRKPVPVEIRRLDVGKPLDPQSSTFPGQSIGNGQELELRSSGIGESVVIEPYFAPNPLVDAGVLYFRLAENQEVNFEVYTADQKQVVSRRFEASRGLNEVLVSAQELGLPGVFLYRLTVGDKSFTGKIITVD